MDGSQTSTSLSSTMAMFPFHPFFLSLPPFVRPFILISAPPVRESPTTGGGGSASYVGCKGHPWGNCTEVARESATYESWESGSASECFLRSMLHLFVTPWILLQIRLIFSAILGKALTEINETPSTSPRDQNRQIRRFGDDLPCRHSSSGWGKSHVGRRGELLQLRPQQWSNGGRLSGKFNLHFVKNK